MEQQRPRMNRDQVLRLVRRLASSFLCWLAACLSLHRRIALLTDVVTMVGPSLQSWLHQ